MPAGGFKTFVAGEILTAADTNDFLMQGVLVFAGTAARGSAITSPVEGQFSYLSDTNKTQFYNGTAWEDLAAPTFEADFLVIAGGGSGGAAPSGAAGGGGAGGYRTSAGTSGANSSAESKLTLTTDLPYLVSVGAGGGLSSSGSNSVLAQVLSIGGGRGGIAINGVRNGLVGGSGGGGAGTTGTGGSGTSNQGSAGGNGGGSGNTAGGGGGGASAAGANTSGSTPGVGGNGLASTITGSSVTRAGGGGGAVDAGTGAAGGTGGGGAGGTGGSGVNGTVNTGGGGGGCGTGGGGTPVPGLGGSGIVIVKYPDTLTATIGAGLTSSTTSSGGFKITSFTAGTDTVEFN
jgi:hypothetical protein